MPLYRNVLWLGKGILEYTSGGFQRAYKNFNPNDLNVDCSNKVFLITGANGSVGQAIVLELAKRGAKIHMVCRNKDKAKIVHDDITKQSRNENIFLHIVDMAEPKEVYEFAQKFVENNECLHVLINNACSLINTRQTNSEGIELNFATNTLSVHILTSTLIPLLSKSVTPRVITISSGSMLLQKLNIEDLQFETAIPYDGSMAYSQTKRQQVVISEKYAEKYAGVHFSTVNPGWVDSQGFQTSTHQFYNKLQGKLRSPYEGADTAVWLAVSNSAMKFPSGLFYLDRKPHSFHLPLANTKSNPGDEDTLISFLDSLLENCKV